MTLDFTLTRNLLNARLREIRKERNQELVRRSTNNKHRSFLFSDETLKKYLKEADQP